MGEWWTYRPSDFLMFSPRAYARLFELANEASWPLQLVASVAAAVWCVRPAWVRPLDGVQPQGSARVAIAFAALCWGWVAWAFFWQRYADINWAATWFAAAFALQAAAFALWSACGGIALHRGQRRRLAGLVLLGWALVGHPLLGVALGGSWAGIEVVGVAPDPTVIATMGLLSTTCGRGRGVVLWRACWAGPLVACGVGSATLATMGSPMVLSLAGAACVAVLGLIGTAREAKAEGTGPQPAGR